MCFEIFFPVFLYVKYQRKSIFRPHARSTVFSVCYSLLSWLRWFSLILTLISLTSAARSLDAYGLKSGIGFQWHALLFITRAAEIVKQKEIES